MPEVLSCTGCGSPVEEGQQFCGICGVRLVGAVEPPPVVPKETRIEQPQAARAPEREYAAGQPGPAIQHQAFVAQQAAVTQQQGSSCPNCGSPIAADQQFCGICGTKLIVAQPEPVIAQPAPTGVAPTKVTYDKAAAPAEMGAPPVVVGPPPTAVDAQQFEPGPAAPQTDERIMRKDFVMKPRRRWILSTAAVIFLIFGWIILVGGCLASIAAAVYAGLGGGFQPVISGVGPIEGMVVIYWAIGGIIASVLYGFGFLAFAELCYTVRDIEKDVRL